MALSKFQYGRGRDLRVVVEGGGGGVEIKATLFGHALFHEDQRA